MSNKAEPTVRWGIKTYEGGGKGTWHLRPDGKRAWWTHSYVEACERVETSFADIEEPRIVKMKPSKPKPKVVAKLVHTDGIRCWALGVRQIPKEVANWMESRGNVRFRFTVEQLES